MKTILSTILLTFMILNFNSASAQERSEYTSVSADVMYQYIGTYDVARLNKIFTTELAEFAPFKQEYPQPKYSVKLYKVLYESVIPEQNNKPTTASGLIAIPETGNTTMPVVSNQHGTVFTKYEVPSQLENSYETRIEVAQFAGNGYILIAADYFGKGSSDETDSYTVKASTQQACLDMYKAAQYVTKALGINMGELYLSGWSQGSYCTLVFLNKLESLGIKVNGAAIASAPTDLFAAVNRWIYNPQPIDAVWLTGCMALQFNSYEEYYSLPGLMNAAIKPEYQDVVRSFYLNKTGYEEFAKKTPAKVLDLLQPEFIKRNSTLSRRFFEILEENQAYRWRTATPLQTYYGDIDEVIPEFLARLPEGYQKLIGGAEVTAIAAGSKADHRGTFLYSVAHELNWFNELQTK